MAAEWAGTNISGGASGTSDDPRVVDGSERTIEQRAPSPVAEAMRAIRKARRMRASEVARAMGMPPRTYENLEEGYGRLTYERMVAFAEATDSDPIAIMAVQATGDPSFALRCADNKLMSIMMIAVMELNDDLGADMTYLDARTLVGGFTRLTRDLAQHVRKRETFAEEWLRSGEDRIRSTAGVPPLARLRPAKR